MALHILTGVACGGLLVVLTPRLPTTIRYLHSTFQTFRTWLDTLIRDHAARAFACEVDARFDHYEQEIHQPLIIFSHTDQWGGTHYDVATIDPTTGQPRMRPAVAFLHGFPIDEQVTQPNAPAIVHHGSFGRPDSTPTPIIVTRARITRVLPVLDALNDWTDDNTNGGAA